MLFYGVTYSVEARLDEIKVCFVLSLLSTADTVW